MTITKDRAIAHYHFKKPNTPIWKIVEFGVVGKDVNFFVINDSYSIRYITPESYGDFAAKRHYKPTVTGSKTTKRDLAYFASSDHYYIKGEEIL